MDHYKVFFYTKIWPYLYFLIYRSIFLLKNKGMLHIYEKTLKVFGIFFRFREIEGIRPIVVFPPKLKLKNIQGTYQHNKKLLNLV